MPQSLEELARAVQSLLAEIDRSVTDFQTLTGLGCPARCGRCCPEGDVYASELELLPAALEIFAQGDPILWWERIQAQGMDPLCVFYRRELEPHDFGHCGMYELRPAVCRAFGFGSVRDRRGDKVMSICKTIKQTNPAAVRAATVHRNEAPCLSDVGTRVYTIDPVLGARQMPINQAIARALERVGLHLQCTVQREKTEDLPG